MEITKRFDVKYFLPLSDPRYNPNYVQQLMMKEVHKNITTVLSEFPSITLSKDAGIINEVDYINYNRNGRVVPETSEHFYGSTRKLTDKKLIYLYGETYSMSVGALSFTVDGMNTYELYKKLVKMTMKLKLLAGTLYYEEGRYTDKPVIHLSNRKELIYNVRISRLFAPGSRFTISNNNGKTIKNFNVSEALSA